MATNNGTHPSGRARRLARLLLLFLLSAAILGSCVSYPAEDAALILLQNPSPGVRIIQQADRIVFVPERAEAGLLFYPGALVAPEAYAPLMDTLAARGILCVLLRMPGNLAVLKQGAAESARGDYPEISRWLVGGHSLGGSIAAHAAAANSGHYDGLVLLASFPADDLRESDLPVLSVYGSEDHVLDRESFAAAKRLLPEDTRELVLPGGCHAGFGFYGPQRGDGMPALSREEQISRTAEAIITMLH